MKPIDKPDFVKLLNVCYSTMLKPLPTFDAIDLWLTILEPYSIDQVRMALSQHMRESKFPPVPADVVMRLPRESDGRPDANEAWAIAIRSRDERDTVVWTQESAEAFSIALPVLEGGDEVGARMAFKAAYERLCEAARAAGKNAQWVKSLGHDPSLREGAIMKAARDGRLSIADASTVIPALESESYEDPIEVKENLRRLREIVESLPSTAEKISQIKAERIRLERLSLENAKQVAANCVAEYAVRTQRGEE